MAGPAHAAPRGAVARLGALVVVTLLAIVGALTGIGQPVGASPPLVLTLVASPTSAVAGTAVTFTASLPDCPSQGIVIDLLGDGGSMFPMNVNYDSNTDGWIGDVTLIAGTDFPIPETFQAQSSFMACSNVDIDSNSLTIAAPAPPPPTPTSTPAPVVAPAFIGSRSSVAAGATVAVDGTGFAPDVDVDITLHSTPVHLATFRTDSTGAFSGSVQIPTDALGGAHQLIATGLGADGLPHALVWDLTVVADSNSLPRTGSSTTPLLVIGSLTAIFGLVVLHRSGTRTRRGIFERTN